MHSQRTGDLYALACALVCGLGNIPAKVALSGTTTEIFNVYFFIFAFIFSGLALFRKKERREIVSTNLRILALIFFLALLFAFALYLFMSALKLIEPATVSFLSRFEVIVTVVLAYIILKERLHPVEILGGVVAVAGVFVLKYKTDITISHAATLMVLSSFFFAVAEILVKKNISKLGTARFLFYRNLFMMAIMYLILNVRGQTLYLPAGETLLLTLAAAILLPVLGRATYMEALRRIDISRAALITQSIPLFTALFTFAILRTYPAPIEWLGGGLIIAGVVLVKLYQGKLGTRRIPE